MEGKSPFTRIILASGSPRRRDLVARMGWPVDARPSALDESPHPGEVPEAVVRRLAIEKARAARDTGGSEAIVVGADTIVVDGLRMLGKPSTPVEAARMLDSLAGKSHRVLTAIALRGASAEGEIVEICETIVPMRDYRRAEVEAYVATGSPMDKAGAYGIQDDGFRLVDLERLRGCFANVMGLPLCHLARALRALGSPPQRDIPAACQSATGYRCPVYREILGEVE